MNKTQGSGISIKNYTSKFGERVFEATEGSSNLIKPIVEINLSNCARVLIYSFEKKKKEKRKNLLCKAKFNLTCYMIPIGFKPI